MNLPLVKEPQNINKLINYMAIVYAFLLPISRAGISLFSILFIVLWLYEGNFKQKWILIKGNKTLLTFLLFIGFSALSILWTENMADAKRPLRMLTYFFTLYVMATSIKKEYLYHIVTAFLLGMFVSEIISYGVYFEWWQFKNATPHDPSPFMSHIDYSVFLAFTAIVLLNRIFSKRYTIQEKIVLLIFFVTVTGNLFIGVGRTGQMAFVAGIIIMSFIHFKFSYKSVLSSVLLISMVFTIAYKTSDNFQRRAHNALNDITKIQNMDFRSSLGIRTAFWQTSYEIVKENPLAGVGIGDFRDATKKEIMKEKYDRKKYAKEFMSTNTPHNQYLLIVLQTGLIGLSLFLLFIYYFLKLPIKDPEWKELSLLYITVFSASCMADTFFMQQFNIALFSFFVGLFISTSIPALKESRR